MKKITLKEAKRLSLIKWEDLSHSGERCLTPDVERELSELLSHCGFCEYQKQQGTMCNCCPLTSRGAGCCFGLYMEWALADAGKRKQYATEILKLVKSIKTDWFHDMYYRLRDKLFLLFN